MLRLCLNWTDPAFVGLYEIVKIMGKKAVSAATMHDLNFLQLRV